jgi:hypothetical protein
MVSSLRRLHGWGGVWRSDCCKWFRRLVRKLGRSCEKQAFTFLRTTPSGSSAGLLNGRCGREPRRRREESRRGTHECVRHEARWLCGGQGRGAATRRDAPEWRVFRRKLAQRANRRQSRLEGLESPSAAWKGRPTRQRSRSQIEERSLAAKALRFSSTEQRGRSQIEERGLAAKALRFSSTGVSKEC